MVYPGESLPSSGRSLPALLRLRRCGGRRGVRRPGRLGGRAARRRVLPPVPRHQVGDELLLGAALENALHDEVAVLELGRLDRVGRQILRLRRPVLLERRPRCLVHLRDCICLERHVAQHVVVGAQRGLERFQHGRRAVDRHGRVLRVVVVCALPPYPIGQLALAPWAHVAHHRTMRPQVRRGRLDDLLQLHARLLTNLRQQRHVVLRRHSARGPLRLVFAC
mmetsp:Transcript_19652/g.33473  ORF Transcript_19652/g.33473 Transcript_19652/m.33473 type:complete len:222 (+) Transcript_19652:158-823(+)